MYMSPFNVYILQVDMLQQMPLRCLCDDNNNNIILFIKCHISEKYELY